MPAFRCCCCGAFLLLLMLSLQMRGLLVVTHMHTSIWCSASHRRSWCRDDNLTLSQFSPFFECAEEIEASRRAPGQRVIWYFISDSVYLRRLVQRAYGSKVLTSLDPHYLRYGSARAQDPSSSLLTAAGELWLFSLVDYHVLSLNSNFGAAGALWSRRWHHMYNLNSNINRRRKCGVMDYDTGDVHFFR